MRIVFLGTPEFATPSLRLLSKTSGINIVAVISQPDKAIGRKQIITPPPVKILAEEFGLPVFQPERISQDEKVLAELKKLKPDALVTVAYGQILRENVLNLTAYGVINLHASLLPQYRGPAPINWMIINGEKTVGVSTMKTVLEVDAGDILLEAKTELGENETALELSERLSQIGAELLQKTLVELDSIEPRIQNYSAEHSFETRLAPFMDKRLGILDFSAEQIVLGSANPKQSDFKVIKKNSAVNIHNLVRGSYPWPGASFMHGEQKIILLKTKVFNASASEEIQEKLNKAEPGEIIAVLDKSFILATQSGAIEILRLKPQGKSEMDAKAWLNGVRLILGDCLA